MEDLTLLLCTNINNRIELPNKSGTPTSSTLIYKLIANIYELGWLQLPRYLYAQQQEGKKGLEVLMACMISSEITRKQKWKINYLWPLKPM